MSNMAGQLCLFISIPDSSCRRNVPECLMYWTAGVIKCSLLISTTSQKSSWIGGIHAKHSLMMSWYFQRQRTACLTRYSRAVSIPSCLGACRTTNLCTQPHWCVCWPHTDVSQPCATDLLTVHSTHAHCHNSWKEFVNLYPPRWP